MRDHSPDGVYRSECNCGWSIEDSDAAVVRDEAEKHRQLDGALEDHKPTDVQRVSQ